MTTMDDWTLLDGSGSGSGGDGDENGGSNSTTPHSDSEKDATTTITTTTTNPPPVAPKPAAAVRFPCIEQPTRVTLHCNGYYLWGCRNGTLIARKKRSEKDEWRIENSHCVVADDDDGDDEEQFRATLKNQNRHVVNICNHKYGGRLSLVDLEHHSSSSSSSNNKIDGKNGGLKTVRCVKEPTTKAGGASSSFRGEGGAGVGVGVGAGIAGGDLGLDEEIDFRDPSEVEKLPGDEGEDDDPEEEEEVDPLVGGTALFDALNQENQQWSLVRCSDEHGRSSGVMIQSLKTGDRLAITDDGRVVVVVADASNTSESAPGPVWEMECVTGELCFLSNPTLDVRMRCDMTGLLTLSPNWKGWEVVRILDDSSGDGYVKISSWMHSQWLLCSDAHGNVSTCSHADSLLSPETWQLQMQTQMQTQMQMTRPGAGAGAGTGTDPDHEPEPYRCSKWAIEKYEGVGGYPGVIIRSKTHNRLLSIRDGTLRTYDSLEEISKQADAILEEIDNFDDEDNTDTAAGDVNGNDNVNVNVNGNDAAAPAPANLSTDHLADIVKRKGETMKRRSSDWWKNSVKNVQKKMSDSAIQRRNSTNPVDFLTRSGREEKQAIAASIAAIPEAETIVWQLEAAHLQTYYFLSSPPPSPSLADGEPSATTKPRSIGAFPNVTENLRSSDKIRLLRNDDEIDAVRLYLAEKELYVTCSSKGNILLTKNKDDEGAEWIVEQGTDGTTVFASKAHGLYLSYKEVEQQRSNPTTKSAAAAEGGEEQTQAAPPTDDEGQQTSSEIENPGNEDASATPNTNTNTNPSPSTSKGGSAPAGKFKIPFENLLPKNSKTKKISTELCGSQVRDPSALWKLEPCTPRAVSSEKLKTFAIGTSIAVGTTIAMPFALAGVAAVMGAVGAEAGIGFGLVAAGLTGAEAIASVGAIGATAYICFRPSQNSLTDEHNPQESKGASKKPWSKRPFSNWRNW